jgi:hypothetical protein
MWEFTHLLFDIETLKAIRYMGTPLYQEKERLEGTNETEIAIPDTYDNLTHVHIQLKESLIFQPINSRSYA